MYLILLKNRYINLSQKIKKYINTGVFIHSLSSTPGSAPIYRDTWLKLIGSFAASHYIEVLGREESLFYLLLQRFYYVDVISGFFIAFIIWELISRISQYLDRRFTWEEQTTIRAVLQIVLGVFVSSVVLHLLTYLQFTYLLHQKMADTSWYIYELPAGIMVITLVNSYYLSYYFFHKYQILKQSTAGKQAEKTLSPAPLSTEALPAKKKRKVFIINKGYRHIPLPVEEIAYFYKKDENNYLRTFANEAYLIDESLEDIYAQLDESLFFRANRQTIINFYACQYYSSLEYGKLEVTLVPTTEEAVIISQKRAPLFKEWVSK